jgi:hemoglobin
MGIRVTDINDPVGFIHSVVGADEPFYRLVDNFYAGVEKDPVLRPLYPEDLTEPRRNLSLFLIQRTGGATTYSDERGHPRMRIRHAPFKIGQAERDAWIKNMFHALDQVEELKPHADVLRPFLDNFATMLINQAG